MNDLDVNLGVLPDEVASSARMAAEAGNETIVGWRALTESGPTCDRGCMAPGSSPHSHSTITGYEVMTVAENKNGSIFRFDAEGYIWSHGTLHRFPNEEK